MRLKAIVIIPRISGVFQLKDTQICRSWGFRGFSTNHVEAAYRKDDPINGYAVALILEPSQADIDFGVPIFFLAEDHMEKVSEAFEKSDELTEALLGRGWKGKRPYLMLHHFM